MSDLRLAIIDGTGPAGDAYAQVMENSFCSQLGKMLGDAAFYQRGPELLGLEVHAEALRAYLWLRAAYEHDPTLRLMVAGYSRGGSAAIMTCELLERDGIAVDALFLFDAVARHEFRRGKVIPANVRFSRHARRCHARDFVMKYEGTLKQVRMVGGLENPIRPEFGNTGLTWRGDGDHRPAEVFLGSHGALGGVGWSMVAEDDDCERAVAVWMSEHLRAQGVEVPLRAETPPLRREPTNPSRLEQWLAHNVYQFVLPAEDGLFSTAAAGAGRFLDSVAQVGAEGPRGDRDSEARG